MNHHSVAASCMYVSVSEAGVRPEILSAGSETVVDAGRDVQFACDAHGTPRPFILWYKDDTILDHRHPRSFLSSACLLVLAIA